MQRGPWAPLHACQHHQAFRDKLMSDIQQKYKDSKKILLNVLWENAANETETRMLSHRRGPEYRLL
jgi:hypothetical protein